MLLTRRLKQLVQLEVRNNPLRCLGTPTVRPTLIIMTTVAQVRRSRVDAMEGYLHCANVQALPCTLPPSPPPKLRAEYLERNTFLAPMHTFTRFSLATPVLAFVSW